jgi:glycosyltransferase involved in cell wall biosynthesis
MHVALLTNNRLPPREGIGHHVSEIARRLRERGHGVTVVARGAGCRGWRAETIAGVRVRHYPHLPLKPLHHALDRVALQRWVAGGADGADVLHVHLPLLPPLRGRQRLVVTVHTPMLTDTAAITEPGLGPALARLNARWLSRAYEQWYLDHASEVLAVSGPVRDEIVAHYRTAAGAIRVVENGVDGGFFGFRGPAGRRDEILFVGRLAVRKGLSRLLAAFRALGPGVCLRLVIAGEGPLEGRLRARAAALGIADRVDFLGFLDRPALRARLQAAAVFVCPSDYEGFPLTLLEAMACGAPVVSTRSGPLAEPARFPVLLVDADAEALADGIVGVLSRPAEAAERALAARRLVEERHSWERVVDALEEAYGAPRRLAA